MTALRLALRKTKDSESNDSVYVKSKPEAWGEWEEPEVVTEKFLDQKFIKNFPNVPLQEAIDKVRESYNEAMKSVEVSAPMMDAEAPSIYGFETMEGHIGMVPSYKEV